MLGRSALLVLLGSGLFGCYGHRTVHFSETREGEMVRVHLTESGTVRLEETFGLRDRQLQGEVLDSDADRLLVTFNPPGSPGGATLGTRRREFAISPGHISSLELRQLDPLRTSALVVGGGIALSLGFYLIKVISPGGGLPGTGGPGDFFQGPAFR